MGGTSGGRKTVAGGVVSVPLPNSGVELAAVTGALTALAGSAAVGLAGAGIGFTDGALTHALKVLPRMATASSDGIGFTRFDLPGAAMAAILHDWGWLGGDLTPGRRLQRALQARQVFIELAGRQVLYGKG